MKKLISLSFCFSLLFGHLSAQEIVLTWAPDLSRENFFLNDFNPFHLDDDAYYVLACKRREAAILKFDLNHNYISKMDFTDFQDKQHIEPEKKIETKNFTYAYSVLGNAKANKSNLYTSQLQQDGFEKLKVKYAHPLNIRNTCLYDIGLELSPDSMLIAYVNDQESAKYKDNKSITVAVFNERFGLLWEKEMQLDVPARRLEHMQTIVGNDGVVYMLARKFIPAREREILFKAYEYAIYKLHHTGIEKKILESDLETIMVDMRMSLHPKTGELSVSGFYQNKFIGPGIQGFFYTSGNVDKGFTSNSFFSFDSELLSWFNSPKALEKEAGIPENFIIKEQIRHPNGDLSLIAEDYFVTSDEEDDDDDDEYHSYDMLVARFSASGELKNIAHVPKYFNDDIQNTASYSFTTVENDIYLLFNYTKRRGDFEEDEEKCFSCVYTDLVILNQEGEIESGTLLVKSKPRDGKIFPLASATNDGAFLIISKNRRNSTIGLLRQE